MPMSTTLTLIGCQDLLDRFHAVVDVAVGMALLGITVTQKMHQICVDKRDSLIEERHMAVVKARKVHTYMRMRLFEYSKCINNIDLPCGDHGHTQTNHVYYTP